MPSGDASMTDLTLERVRSALSPRYEVEHELGRGGMAAVYLATDCRHARSVAVKVLNTDFVSGQTITRFLREIRVTASLTHPNILPLLDSGESDGLAYYVMPFVAGQSLQ